MDLWDKIGVFMMYLSIGGLLVSSFTHCYITSAMGLVSWFMHIPREVHCR